MFNPPEHLDYCKPWFNHSVADSLGSGVSGRLGCACTRGRLRYRVQEYAGFRMRVIWWYSKELYSADSPTSPSAENQDVTTCGALGWKMVVTATF